MTVGNATVSQASVGTVELSLSDDFDSLVVLEADLPSGATVGDGYNVTVTVLNPTDERISEFVQYRIGGSNVQAERVGVPAGETGNVTFETEELEFPEGEFTQSVNTSSHSVFNTIGISAPEGEERPLDAVGDDQQMTEGDEDNETLADGNETDGNETTADNETAGDENATDEGDDVDEEGATEENGSEGNETETETDAAIVA